MVSVAFGGQRMDYGDQWLDIILVMLRHWAWLTIDNVAGSTAYFPSPRSLSTAHGRVPAVQSGISPRGQHKSVFFLLRNISRRSPRFSMYLPTLLKPQEVHISCVLCDSRHELTCNRRPCPHAPKLSHCSRISEHDPDYQAASTDGMPIEHPSSASEHLCVPQYHRPRGCLHFIATRSRPRKNGRLSQERSYGLLAGTGRQTNFILFLRTYLCR